MDHMAGSSISGRPKPLVLPPRERQAIRRRIGAFIRARRKEMGLTSGDIVRALGYKHLASVWKLEKGLEGLPTKRVFAWADILQVPRDAFFRFVTGEVDRMDMPGRAAEQTAEQLATSEVELLDAYRRLPSKYQRRLRESAREYDTLASAEKRRGG
jgi:transcriptional regulator with XRE-family HTH domain